METLLKDLRFGRRMLVKNSGSTVIAVLTLALSIGANTTIFSWINSTLLDPIPGAVRTSELISVMRGTWNESPVPPFSYPDYVDLRSRNRSFSGLLAYQDDTMTLTGTGRPLRIWGSLTSANYFDVLGVRPILGRAFLQSEEQKPGGAPVVVISHGLWQTHFGADSSVVGRIIEINRHPYTIIGVAPPGFQGCKTGLRSDLWIPLMMDHWVFLGDRLERRGTYWLQALGRLKTGVDRRQAQQEMNLLMQQIVAQYPDSHQGPNEITIDPLWRSPFGANVYLYRSLPVLMALAGVVLLLACANVANLLLVRSMARRREISIRLSIGASRSQLVRQLLTESLLLALAGGGTALLLTAWSAGTYGDFIPPTSVPITLNGHIDRTVLLATLVVSILTGLIFGILPALRSSTLIPATVLKEEAGSASAAVHKARLSSGLVVVQISLSSLLLICAGLFIRSLQNAQRSDPGFDPNHVLLASFELSPVGYSAADGLKFDRELLNRLEALPGVDSAALADWVPLSLNKRTEGINPEGYVPRLHESMDLRRAIVSPNYFHLMRIPLVAGREFTAQDTDKSLQVAIVNQELASRYWPGQNVIGKRLYARGRWFTVVGVARNGKYHRMIDEAPEPLFYLPLFQSYRQDAIIHARIVGNPQLFAMAVTNAVHELDPNLPVFNVTSLQKNVQIASIFERIAGTFVGAFGLIALVLATVGIYGVIAYTTRQRAHEIGVRMALGARQADVLRLVLAQGLRLTLAGLALGLVVALALTRLLGSMLIGVTNTDTLTYASVAALLSLVALSACFIPAWRAAKVDPTVALHHE